MGLEPTNICLGNKAPILSGYRSIISPAREFSPSFKAPKNLVPIVTATKLVSLQVRDRNPVRFTFEIFTLPLRENKMVSLSGIEPEWSRGRSSALYPLSYRDIIARQGFQPAYYFLALLRGFTTSKCSLLERALVLFSSKNHIQITEL
jgi:hypothetical protein